MSAPRHLYVHVPFCAHRCGYCDFVTTSHQPQLHDRYVAALRREHDRRASEVATYDTIFVGGGTPSLLGPGALSALLGWLGERLAPGGELTIECNPETIDAARADCIVQAGVNRVSLGAQSFSPHVLEVLERRASPDTVRAAVAHLRDAGIDNLNIDLVWGVPGQRPDDLQRDLDELLALEPEHVSAYELEFKPGTRLSHAYPNPDDALGDDVEEFYEAVVARMEAAGRRWYETANFARPGFECRHNLAYWTQRDHLGIGVGAIGTLAGERRTNLPNLPRYLAAIEAGLDAPARIEAIDDATSRYERYMLALRLGEPVELRDADADIIDADALPRLEGWGLAQVRGKVLHPTRRGRFLLNTLLTELLRDPATAPAAASF